MSGEFHQQYVEELVAENKRYKDALEEISKLTDFHELPPNWEEAEEGHARDLDNIITDVKLIADKALGESRPPTQDDE